MVHSSHALVTYTGYTGVKQMDLKKYKRGDCLMSGTIYFITSSTLHSNYFFVEQNTTQMSDIKRQIENMRC